LKLELQNTFLESIGEMCKKSFASPAPAPELLIFNNLLAEELKFKFLSKGSNQMYRYIFRKRISAKL
jgi:hypothetical protein